MGGSFNSFDQTNGYTKYVGTIPTNTDARNWYTTVAAAAPVAGDRILVVNGYTLTATETWAFNNVTIVFMPNQQLTFTNATTRALYITGNSNSFYGLWVRLNLATLTSGLEISGTDNQIYGSLVESYNAGLTLTNAFTLSGSRNTINGDRLVTSGAITNKVGSTANDSLVIVSGSVALANELIATNIGVSSGTSMLNVNGYSRIVSPTQTIRSAGSESLDFSLQHIYYKTGGTATITLSNLVEGQTVNVILRTIAAAYTITWSPTIIWGPTGIPTPTNATNKYDFYTFIKVGGNIFGTAILAMA